MPVSELGKGSVRGFLFSSDSQIIYSEIVDIELIYLQLAEVHLLYQEFVYYYAADHYEPDR